MKTKPKDIRAITLLRDVNENWSVAELKIKGDKVETVSTTKPDLLLYTLARARQILDQITVDLKKS